MIKVSRIDHSHPDADPTKDFEIEQRRSHDGNAIGWALSHDEAWAMVNALLPLLAEDAQHRVAN